MITSGHNVLRSATVGGVAIKFNKQTKTRRRGKRNGETRFGAKRRAKRRRTPGVERESGGRTSRFVDKILYIIYDARKFAKGRRRVFNDVGSVNGGAKR